MAESKCLNQESRPSRRLRISFLTVLVICLGSLLFISRYLDTHLEAVGRFRMFRDIFDLRRIYNQQQEPQKQKIWDILYYNPSPFITKRIRPLVVNFSSCAYTNCRFTDNKKHVNHSDVVIFDGRFVKEMLPRKPGQLWVFAGHEPICSYCDAGCQWRKVWKDSFNFTMLHDKHITDVYWPYGEIIKRSDRVMKNFTEIFLNKTKEVLIVNSHCGTRSKRERYIKSLSKYIEVDVLGACGKPLRCGQRYVHDDCFKIINDYKFYLAFENSLCSGYFTEKVFENYDYDSILVVRGGEMWQAAKEFPSGVFISTDFFPSIELLGLYLKGLSSSMTAYTKMLQRKSEFYSPTYNITFQNSMCRVCERLNNLDKYNNTIPDIGRLIFGNSSCRNPTDLEP